MKWNKIKCINKEVVIANFLVDYNVDILIRSKANEKANEKANDQISILLLKRSTKQDQEMQFVIFHREIVKDNVILAFVNKFVDIVIIENM